MKRVLAGLLGLGICLSPLRGVAGGVEIDLRPLSVGSQGRELLAQGIDSRKAEADRLFEQGKQQNRTSQFEAALQSWQEALIIYKQIKYRQGEFAALGSLGNAYFSIGDYEKAIAFLQQALTIAQELKSPWGEGAIFASLGNAYRLLGDYKKAIDYYQEALTLLRERKDRQGEGVTLGNLGNAYLSLGNYGKAIDYYQQDLIIALEIKDREGEGRALGNLAIAYRLLGDYKKPITYLQQALAIAREIKNRQGEGNALGNLGETYGSLGDYGKAIVYNQQHLIIALEIKDRQGEGNALGNLGNAYGSLGNYGKAITFHQQHLIIARQIKDRQGEGNALGSLGNAYGSLGDYGKAITFHQQALTILRKIKNRQGEGNALGNLGETYGSLGDYGKAIVYNQQHLIIARQIKDRQGEGGALNNLGIAYHLLGDYEKALTYFQQALSIAREIKDRRGEGNSLLNLGNAYDSLGKHDQAIDYYQQGLIISIETKNRQVEGISLSSLGITYGSLGDYEKAIAYFQQALNIAREIKDRKDEGGALHNLGTALVKSGKLLEAEQSLREGIQVWESLRAGLQDANKISIFEWQARTYRALQEVLIAQNRYIDALEISERGRTRAFVELLAQRLNASQPSSISIQPLSIDSIKTTAKQQNATLIEYSIIYDDFKIQGRKQGKESELYIWVIQPNGTVTFRTVDLKPLWQSQEPVEAQNITPINLFWQQNLQTYSYPIIILLLLIVMGSFMALAYSAVYADKTSKKSQASRPKLAQTLLGLVATSGTISIFFLVIQMQNQQSLEVATRSPQPPKSPLAKLVFSAQESLGVPNRGLLQITSGQSDKTIKENWQQLHQILIQPIADLLPTDPNSRVIFIPQNDLFFVPFPALIDANGKYLIEKHTILTAPSIQVLSLTHQQRQRLGASRLISSLTNPNFLVVGNPTMPKISQYPGEPATQLDALPGAEKEAKKIATLLKTNAIIGNQATKTAIVEKMPQARIIHLATHGLLNDLYTGDIPGAIALAPNNQGDGLLTSREILQMKLNAELVVLSACDTGKGRITGDGIIGLSRALFTAGVPSAIVSLWPINDGSTAFLMANFYQNLQHNPNKAQALRQAMLVTMKKYPDPRSWAAFTLMGEAE